MSVQELKEILIEKIRDEQNENILASVYRILSPDSLQEPEVVYLTEAQKKGIEESLEDIQAGRTQSHEEVMQEMKEWLNQRAAG